MTRMTVLVFGMAMVATAAFASGQGDEGYGASDGYGRGYGRQATGTESVGRFDENHSAIIEGIEPGELSAEEAEALVWMREEEKLARDVYAALYEVWNYPVFSNISRSEQQHMDAVLALLDRYGIDDPAGDDTAGVFTSAALQELYDELVATGKQSLVDALTVGATIEDLDMADLLANLEMTDNEDISLVFESLLRGSENHIRSFVAQLERQDVTYEAQYVTADYLASIIGSENGNPPIAVAGGRGAGRRGAF
jgi:hypothetical protein